MEQHGGPGVPLRPAAVARVGQAVNLAVERFVTVGETIADDYPEVRQGMYEACKEARQAGKFISILPFSFHSNRLVLFVLMAAETEITRITSCDSATNGEGENGFIFHWVWNEMVWEMEWMIGSDGFEGAGGFLGFFMKLLDWIADLCDAESISPFLVLVWKTPTFSKSIFQYENVPS